MQEIDAVRQGIDDETVEILIVNLTKSDRMDQAKEIIASFGLEAISYYDVNGDIQDNFDIIGVPAAIYINPDGTIKETTFGPDHADGILEKIKK